MFAGYSSDRSVHLLRRPNESADAVPPLGGTELDRKKCCCYNITESVQ